MISKDNEAGQGRMNWLVGGFGMLALLVLFVWWPGCRVYPTASSPESMYLIKLTYTACNTKDQGRLSKVEQEIKKAADGGKLTATEQHAFEEILVLARQEEWDEAEQAALRFAQDQVGYGHPASHGEVSTLGN